MGIWKGLLATPEGRLLLAGLGLSAAGLLALALSWWWLPDQFQLLVGLTATACLFGRAAALSFGYAVGLGHAVVIGVAMLVETIFVLIIYPLFVFAWSQLLELRALGKFMDRTNRAANAHEASIRRYGIPGLLIFVWFPFWLTGPVVGSVIGFLLGLPLWVTMSVVLSGTFLAIVCWALLLRQVQDLAAAYSAMAPMIMVLVLILAALLAQAWYSRRQARKGGKR